MANEPGGTKFAQLITEIDLDRSKYDKKLDESVEAANLATIKIEKAFKQLGVRTDQSYEQQRVAITTFYKKIIDDANVSANERAAAEQMLARKIEAINNKQYSALNSMRQAQVKAEEDSVKQRDQLWTNMGVRSNAQIELQKKQVMDSYNQLKSGAQNNHVELIRLEAAKNEKLARLDDEMFGKKRMTLASLQRDILRTYASFYILSAGVQYISTEFVGASLKMERINSTLNTITGSIYGTTEAMGYIRGESKRLGLDMETAALSYSKFAVSARGTTMEGEKARKVFTGVSEAVAAMKLPASEADGIFLALSQMISKGTVSMEELRRQLGDRLPGAFQMAAKAMGVSTAELNKMVAAGNVQADELLPKLAEELHKTYGKAAVDAAEQGQAAINRYNNAIFESKAAIGEVIMTTMIPALALWAEGVDILTKKWKAFINPTDTDVLKKQAEALQTQIAGLEKWQNSILADKSGVAAEQLARARKELELINKTLGMNAEGGYNPPKPPTPKAGPSQAQLEAEKKAAKELKKMQAEDRKGLLEGIEVQKKEYEDLLIFKGKLVDDEAKQREDASKKASDLAIAQYKQITDLEKKQLDSREKNFDAYKKMWADEADFAITENERAINKIISDYDMKVLKLNELQESKESIPYRQYMDLKQRYTENKEKAIAETKYKALQDQIKYLGDLEGTETRVHDLRMQQIDKEVKEMKSLGVDEAIARRYAANESDKAFIKMTRGSENFFQGTRAAFITLQEDAIRWGQVGTAVGSTFKTSLGIVMGDAIYQIIKGGFKEDSLATYAATVADACMQSFTKKLGEKGSDYVTDALGTGWDYFLGFLSPDLGPTAGMSGGGDIFGKIKTGYSQAIHELGNLSLTGEGGVLSKAWNTVKDMFSNTSGTGVWDYLKKEYKTATDYIKNFDLSFLSTAWTTVSNLFSNSQGTGAWDRLASGYDVAKVSIMNQDWSFLRTSWTAVKDMFSNASGTGIWDTVKSGATTAWDTISGIDWAGIGNTITGAFSSIASAFSGTDITMTFETVWKAADEIWKYGAKVLGGLFDYVGSSIDWAGLMNIGGGEVLTPAYGGLIPGTAQYAGDNYGNDRIPAMISPGEYVVPRSAVNADSLEVLEYIRKNKKPPGFWEGGLVGIDERDQPILSNINWDELDEILAKQSTVSLYQPEDAAKYNGYAWTQYDRTSDPYNGGWTSTPHYQVHHYWTTTQKTGGGLFGFSLSDWAGTLTGGISDVIAGIASGDVINGVVTSLTRVTDNPVINPMDKFGTYSGMLPFRALNAAGLVNDDSYNMIEKYMQDLAHAVGMAYAMAGAFGTSPGTDVTGAGMGGAGEAATAFSTDQFAVELAKKMAVKEIAKLALSYVLGGVGGGGAGGQIPSASMSMNYSTDDNGLFSKLTTGMKDIAPKEYGYPAKDGLDYVPYDNFPARLHKGERVQTAKEAEADRTEGSNRPIIHTHVYLDRKQIALAVGDELDTNPRLKARYN